MRTSDKVSSSSASRSIATDKKKSLWGEQSNCLNDFWSTVLNGSDSSCFINTWKKHNLSSHYGSSPGQSRSGVLTRDTQHISSFFLAHSNTVTASLYSALLCSSSYLKSDQPKPDIYLDIIRYFFSSFQKKILGNTSCKKNYIQTSLAVYPHIKNDKIEALMEQLYAEFKKKDRELVIDFIDHFPELYRMVCRLTHWEVSEEEFHFLEKTVRDMQREAYADQISTSALAREWVENLDLLAPPTAVDDSGAKKIIDNIDFQNMSYSIPETIFSDTIHHRKLTLSASRQNSFEDVIRLWKNSIQSYLSQSKYTAEQLSIQEYMYEMLLSVGKEKSVESSWALNFLSALDTKDIPFDFWFTLQLFLQRKREIPGANFGLMVIYCFNIMSMPASHLPFYNIMWPDIFCSLFGRYTYRFLYDTSISYFENILKRRNKYHIDKETIAHAIKRSLFHDDLDGSQGFVAYARDWEEKFPGRAQRAKSAIKVALGEVLSDKKNSSPKMIYAANYASSSTVSFGSPLLASSGPSGPLTPISQSSGSSSTLSLSPAKPEDFEHYMEQRQSHRFTDATFSVLSEKLAKTFPKTSENIAVDTILNDSIYKLEQYDYGKTIEHCTYKIAYKVKRNGHTEERILGEKEIHLSKHPSDNAYVYEQILSTKYGRFVLSATFKEQGECHALGYVVTVPDNASEYYIVKPSLENNEGYSVVQKALRYRVYENRKGCSDLRPYTFYKREQPNLGNYIILNEMVRNPKYQRPVEVHNQYMSYPLYVSYGRDADDAMMQGPLTRYQGYTICIQKEKGKNTEWNLTFQGDEGKEDFIGKTLNELNRLESYDYYNNPSAKIYAKNGSIEKIVYDSKAVMLIAENINFNYPHRML